MFRYKTHKQAFIIATLVILLCLACLAGATLALFTSDLNDGTIGIVTTSGEVDIDIVDLDGVTLQNRALAFISTAGTPIDSETVLFEPGATFYTQGFKIKNDGNIPVNFRISVSKGVDKEEFEKAFDLWIVKEGDDVRNAQELTDFIEKGLEADKSSATYFLIIRMKEDVGNAFQNKRYTGIGVTVYAVQGNVEIKE